MNHFRATLIVIHVIALCSSISIITAMESITISNQTRDDIDRLIVRFNVKVKNQDIEETYLGFIIRERFSAGQLATFNVEDAMTLVGPQGSQIIHPLISYLVNNSKNVQTATLDRIECDQFFTLENTIPNAPALVIKGNDRDSYIVESNP